MEQLDDVKREAALTLRQTEAAVVVASPDDEKRAALVIAQTKEMLKKVEAKRKDFVQPLNEHVKKINAEFKAIMEPMEAALARMSAAVITYRQSDAYKETQEYRDAIMAEARIAAEAGDIGTLRTLADAKSELDQVAPKSVKTEAGTVGTMKVWRYEVIDPSAVPDQFYVLDTAAITRAVKGGMRECAGLRIFVEETITTRA
jgi:hypothetical protein